MGCEWLHKLWASSKKGVEIWSPLLPSIERKDREGYLIFVVRVTDPSLLSRIGSIQQEIQSVPCVEIIPAERLHISIKDGGYLCFGKKDPDDILLSRLPEIIFHAQQILGNTVKFKVRIGRVNAFSDSIFLEVLDEGQVLSLQKRLGEGLNIPFSPREQRRFLPHITIARIRNREGLRELKRVLGRLEKVDQGQIEMLVDAIQLVRIDERKVPPWEILQEFPLKR